MTRTEMLEAKDPAIKLFGKTISFPDIPATAAIAVAFGDPLPLSSDTPVDDSHSLTESENDDTNRVEEEQESEKDHPLGGRRLTDAKQEDGAKCSTLEETTDPNVNSPINENPKTPSIEKESATEKTSNTEEDQSENNSEEKTLKKPDKIIPCPRCSSMDTKFCYYNNYNLNQPRYFCKNCQRYWTAGGTMRNVPVGAGRRKNKNSASHYRHISSESLVLVDLPNGIHHPPPKSNASVLAFGSDTPHCEPMASVLNIAEKTMSNCKRNGFQRPEELRIPVFGGGGQIGDDKSIGSSGIAVNSNFQSFPPQGTCFPGSPWPYPWNASQWSPPVPPFYYVAPYWSCSVPGSWNVPWVSPPTFSPNQTTPSSGPMSPTLGKHSRDEDLPKQTNSGEEEPQKEDNPKKCFWIPKTLRIDDPGEAAKSSIWSALGIKHDKANSISGGGIFKAFRSKGEEKNYVSETSAVLQANPAALCRSLNFQERV